MGQWTAAAARRPDGQYRQDWLFREVKEETAVSTCLFRPRHHIFRVVLGVALAKEQYKGNRALLHSGTLYTMLL